MLRRKLRDQSIAIAKTTAITIAITTPNTTSLIVVHIAGQRFERSFQVERTTARGPEAGL